MKRRKRVVLPVVAIDPGVTGALAYCAGERMKVYDLPSVVVVKNRKKKRRIDRRGLRKLLLKVIVRVGPADFVIEDVHAMPKNGSIGNFKLGQTAGLLEGILIGLGIEPVFHSPQKWKRVMGVTKEKGSSLRLARRMFKPIRKRLARMKDHNRAEALLLCKYHVKVTYARSNHC